MTEHNAQVGASTPEEYFGASRVGIETFDRVHAALMASHPDVTVRVSKGQIAFRRGRGFAFLWVPGRYLRRPAAPVVLSLALRRRLESERVQEVAHPGPWMHHLEITSADPVDDEVVDWLHLAAEEAGPSA